MLFTRSILVKGKVQGVFYRQSGREKAKEIGVTGTISNLPDDSVQIIATGTSEQLDTFEAWCSVGPPRARVSEVISSNLPTEEFASFSIVD
jgi:acylphosphatase